MIPYLAIGVLGYVALGSTDSTIGDVLVVAVTAYLCVVVLSLKALTRVAIATLKANA